MARTSIFTVKAENGKAVIRIIGRISEWKDSALNFTNALDEVIAQGITTATLYLRTEGGSVFEANDIVNAIKKFKGEIICESGALVASAGTYIAVSCSKVKVPTNTQWMFHKPMAEMTGNEDEIERQLKSLTDITKIIASIYAKKTNKPLTEIEKLWASGDHWMGAQELKDYGFADEILDSEDEITTEDIAALRQIGYRNIPKIAATLQETTKINMKLSAKAAGLGTDATDEQISSEIDRLKRENTELKEFKSEQERLSKEALKQSVVKCVDKAITDKKITSEVRDTYLAIGEKNGVEALNKVFDQMKGVKSISSQVPAEGSGSHEEDAAIPQARKDWSFDKWSDEDPKGLQALHEKNPEAFKKLYHDQFGEDPE